MLKSLIINNLKRYQLLKNIQISSSFATQAPKSTSYYCKVLGIKNNFTQQQLKSAYLQMVKKYHPDLSKQPNASQKFQQVQKAYDFLQNPEIIRKNNSEKVFTQTQKSTEDYQKAQNFEYRFGQRFKKKTRVEQNMQFSYNLYKKHYQQIHEKKKDYTKYRGQQRQQWAHKDQKQQPLWKSYGVGAAIIGLVGGSIYFVNIK